MISPSHWPSKAAVYFSWGIEPLVYHISTTFSLRCLFGTPEVSDILSENLTVTLNLSP